LHSYNINKATINTKGQSVSLDLISSNQ